ncbi:MAG: hypothetical protein KBD16_04150 [Candidatus Pacebacteria bacterium]|nr:hypothetical protein [Candidatus Paceibacterota bacterium]
MNTSRLLALFIFVTGAGVAAWVVQEKLVADVYSPFHFQGYAQLDNMRESAVFLYPQDNIFEYPLGRPDSNSATISHFLKPKSLWDSSKTKIEIRYEESLARNSYHVWTYSPTDSPLSSVTIYDLYQFRFDPVARTADTHRSFHATCSVKKEVTSEFVRTIIQQNSGTTVNEDDIELGATLDQLSVLSTEPGDSLWSLAENYLTSLYGAHFTDGLSGEKNEMIDRVKDALIVHGSNKLQNPDIIYPMQMFDTFPLTSNRAECFWLVAGQDGAQWVVSKDGEVTDLAAFPKFQVNFVKNNAQYYSSGTP